MTYRAPAFQFYPKDYESDEHVKLMSLEQEGAYLRLLCHAWMHGSIPADVPTIAKICRVPKAKMARLWSGVKPCWNEAGEGRLVNGRQERDRVKQAERREIAAEKGREGAESRWHRHSSGHAPAKAQAMPGDGSAVSVSSLLSATPETENERSFVPSSEKQPSGNGSDGGTEAQRREYADAVWSEFLRVSGEKGTRLMTPGEFSTARGWMDAGIPLRVVLRGMADTKGKGRMLGYYNSSVLAAFEYHRQAVPL